MFLKVVNPYDSHVHWLSTGLKQCEVSLQHLTCGQDATKLVHKPNRGSWMLGYGWDNNLWKQTQLPVSKDLSHYTGPVAFTRIDGHALWVNRHAVDLAGGPKRFRDFPLCPLDVDGYPKGVLVDSAMNPILDVIPKASATEQQNALLRANKYFNENGFTHIRDLTCSTEQWQAATQLENQGQLSLAVEEYFDCLPFRNFDLALNEAQYCKKQISRFRRVIGIKVFFDGALGSEGALMSCCYHGGNNGLQLMTLDELTEVATKTWQNKLRLAVHIIGDEGAHRVISHFNKLKKEGLVGPLDFEHCEILRTDTIELLKNLEASIHMQPCHWLSDKRWIKRKLPDLTIQKNLQLFPWAAIEELNLPLHFGSDAPIEDASILLNQKALEDAAENKIPMTKYPAHYYQSHKDKTWIKDCWSEFHEVCEKVYFENKLIFSSKL